VEGAVGRERGQLRQVGAQRVVHRQRALGAADGDDLDLRRRQLAAEARVPVEALQQLRRDRREVQRRRVEQHGLLLDPDRERRRRVERRAQLRGGWRRSVAGMARSVRIITLPGVFQPRSDARLLAAARRERGLARGARVLDAFTGSGALAVAAAHERACAAGRTRRQNRATRRGARG
jgi:methylase of polypeptide subunit release factors